MGRSDCLIRLSVGTPGGGLALHVCASWAEDGAGSGGVDNLHLDGLLAGGLEVQDVGGGGSSPLAGVAPVLGVVDAELNFSFLIVVERDGCG